MKHLVDPYGISLLDLLSNALAAVILLFLIVSVGSRGNESERSDLSNGEGNGKVVSAQNAKIGEVKDTTAFSVQIDLYNGLAKIDDKSFNDDTIIWRAYKFDIDEVDSLAGSLRQSLLITQKETVFENELSFRLVTIPDQIPCDSTCVTIFNGNTPIVSDFFKFDINNNEITLSKTGIGKVFGNNVPIHN